VDVLYQVWKNNLSEPNKYLVSLVTSTLSMPYAGLLARTVGGFITSTPVISDYRVSDDEESTDAASVDAVQPANISLPAPALSPDRKANSQK
jgi:hypothetical protein